LQLVATMKSTSKKGMNSFFILIAFNGFRVAKILLFSRTPKKANYFIQR